MKTKVLFLTFCIVIGLFFFSGCDDVSQEPEVDAPVDLTVERLAEGRVILTWDYLFQTSDVFYVIARKVGEGEWNENYGEASEKTFVDDIPTNSYTVYSYKVKSVAANEDDETISSFFSQPAAYFSPLTKPSEVDIQQMSQSELEIIWQDNAIGEYGYRIDKRNGNGNWQNEYASLPANSTSFTDQFSTLFNELSYRIYPYVGASQSAKAEITFTPGFPVPANVSAVQLSQNEVRISWNYPEDEGGIVDGFEIFRQIGNTDWILLNTATASSLNYTDVLQIETGTLSYRLRSYANGNYSAFSETVTVNLNIVDVGQLSFSDIGNDLWVEGSNAYIANNFNGILRVDISNQSSPGISGTIPVSGRAISLFYHNQKLYAGNQNRFISIIDLSDPTNPVIINQVQTIDTPYGMVVGTVDNSDYLFVADGIAGLIVISLDSCDPTNPKIVGRMNTQGISHSVIKENNIIYLADGYGGIKKVDVSDPENPVKIMENLYISNAIDLQMKQNRLFVSCGNNGMQIVDKNSLQLINYYDTQGYVVSLDTTNRYGYIADREMGIHLVSIVNENDLYSLALLPQESPVSDIWLQNSYIYLLTEQSLQIIQFNP